MNKEVRDALLRALAAAISVAGVVVVGQAVAWVRFSAADLPADQIVSVLGRGELIAIGTLSLATFVVAGLLATVAAYGLDSQAKVVRQTRDREDPVRTRYGLLALVAVAVVVATIMSGIEAWATALSIAAVSIGVGFHLLFALAPGFFQDLKGTSLGEWIGRALAVLTTAVILLLVGLLWDDGRSWYPLLFLAVAVALGALCFGVAAATGENFRWYAVSVFLSTVLFGAILGIAKTESAPKVQPTGAIVKARGGSTVEVKGVYVGEASKRFCYGSIETTGTDPPVVIENTGALVSIPCDRVLAYGVGDLMPVAEAVGGKNGAEAVVRALEEQRQPRKPEAEAKGCKED